MTLVRSLAGSELDDRDWDEQQRNMRALAAGRINEVAGIGTPPSALQAAREIAQLPGATEAAEAVVDDLRTLARWEQRNGTGDPASLAAALAGRVKVLKAALPSRLRHIPDTALNQIRQEVLGR